MIKNYLPTKIHFGFIAFLAFTFLFGLWLLWFVGALIYVGFWYLFRKQINRIHDDFIDSQNVLSPVNGKAAQVYDNVDHAFFGKGLRAIRFNINFLDEYGVYLPASTEVKNVKTDKIKEINRFKEYEIDKADHQDNGVLIKLKSKVDEFMGLQILKDRFSLNPVVIVQPGDRGRAKANIGVVPFGGSVILYFDKSFKTHIKEGDDVDAGKTIIASSREGFE